ncbi:MAG: hypothetical protein ACRD3N_01215 [Terracidiphilus sp.]
MNASERKRITDRIFKMRGEINDCVFANDVEGQNQRLDAISGLERELQDGVENGKDGPTVNETADEATEEPDSIEEATSAVTDALTELGTVLTDDSLFAVLYELNNPLQQQRNEQTAQARTLRESYAALLPTVEAKRRILSRQVDEELAEGRDGEARKQESAELERNLAKIEEQAEACERRLRELAEEQQENYRAVLDETYPFISQSMIAVEVALLTVLDKVSADLQRFGRESGISGGRNGLPGLVWQKHIAGLTPTPLGTQQERALYDRLRQWFT